VRKSGAAVCASAASSARRRILVSIASRLRRRPARRLASDRLEQPRAHVREQRAGQAAAGEVLGEAVDHGAIDAAREDPAPLAVAVEVAVDAVPHLARRRGEQAGEQIVVLRLLRALRRSARELLEQQLRLVVADQALVRVALHFPFDRGRSRGPRRPFSFSRFHTVCPA
jgi:hypothetical protein